MSTTEVDHDLLLGWIETLIDLISEEALINEHFARRVARRMASCSWPSKENQND